MARILVVDDEPAIRTLVRNLLEDEGHNVVEATDGEAALGLIEAKLPDLIVLDLAMPGMDGWRLLEELYERGLRRRLRVVIISANLDPDAVDRGRRSDVSHFLPKPFDVEALLRLVDDALEQDPNDLVVRHDRTDTLVRLIGRMDEALG